MSSSAPNRRLVVGLAFAALAVLAVAGTSQIDKMIAMLQWVRSAGPLGWAAFAGVYLLGTLAMVPASFLQGAAGFLLGPVVGFGVASAAGTLCGGASFVLARTVLRDVVAGRVRRDPSFLAIDAAIGDGGAYLVGLLRLSPLSPYNVMNYALGLTRVRLRDFLLGTWIGSIPPVLLFSWLGSTVGSLADLLDGGAMSDAAPRLVVLGCTVLASVLIARFAQQALKRALAQAPA